MTTAISVVETAYRATIEEQDDTVLWLTHMLKENGLDMAVLLRSNAVNYAVRGQDASGLRIGGIELRNPPAIDRDVRALLDKGVAVYCVHEDVEERGIRDSDLIDGVKGISRRELPGMLGGFDHIWHW